MLSLRDHALRLTELYYTDRDTPEPAEIVETYREFVELLGEKTD